jgi:hypothetical protein
VRSRKFRPGSLALLAVDLRRSLALSCRSSSAAVRLTVTVSAHGTSMARVDAPQTSFELEFFQYWSRSSLVASLPVGNRGSASTMSKERGTL